LLAALEIEPTQTGSQQYQTDRFRHCRCCDVEADAVVPEMTIRIKSKRNVVAVGNIGTERSQLGIVKSNGPGERRRITEGA